MHALILVQNPPLYLRVTSTSKDGLDAAVIAIKDMMQQDLPNLVDERRFRRREPQDFERDEYGRVRHPRIYLNPISICSLSVEMLTSVA